MAKDPKYYFDHKSLSYRKVRIPFILRLRSAFLWFITTGTLWILIYFLIARFVPTPREMTLKSELDNLLMNYEELNKQMAENEEMLANIENRDDNLYRVIFETDPLPKDKRFGTLSNKQYFDKMNGYNYSDLIINTAKRTEELSKRLYAQSKSLDEVLKMAKNKEKMLGSIPAIPPLSIRASNIYGVSGFGMRLHPITKLWRMHTGMDFAARTGTPIYTSGDGVVVESGWNNGGYGNYVVVDHGYGYKTLYAHMNRIVAFKGKKVTRGEMIGTVGNTGVSKGPHLHYEVIYRGDKVNPINYYYKNISVSEYSELLERASEHTAPLD